MMVYPAGDSDWDTQNLHDMINQVLIQKTRKNRCGWVSSGSIGLYDEDAAVAFNNVRIKEITSQK
jgi:hypothetical protein